MLKDENGLFDRIKNMHQEGWTYHRIAGRLYLDGIPVPDMPPDRKWDRTDVSRFMLARGYRVRTKKTFSRLRKKRAEALLAVLAERTTCTRMDLSSALNNNCPATELDDILLRLESAGRIIIGTVRGPHGVNMDSFSLASVAAVASVPPAASAPPAALTNTGPILSAISGILSLPLRESTHLQMIKLIIDERSAEVKS